jgi:hypothetical protein
MYTKCFNDKLNGNPKRSIVSVLCTLFGQSNCVLYPLYSEIEGNFFNLTTLLVNIYKYVQIHLKITNRQRRERD